ncbi:MAG: site-specific DNA-methyltransferase [Oscillospiraceae bacterium]|nr:site-specific DNA-methyltransferase [Oscillospiraceae bacterium]
MDSVICGDSILEIKNIIDDSVHLILSDIPYGISYDEWDVLHNNNNSALLGKSPAQAKSALFKTRGKPLNGWSEADKKIPHEYYNWCSKWADEWLRVLKPGASCFVFAGRRYSHRCICALEDAGFIFKDMIAWQKDSAAHRAQNVSVIYKKRKDAINEKKWTGWKVGNLRPLFEPILWFMKPYKIGDTLSDNIKDQELGGFNEIAIKSNPLSNKGLEICSNVIKCKTTSQDRGLHPAQKPVSLMKYLIEMTTIEGQVVLDPFCGCGSTILAAKELKRKYIGIEKSKEYCDIIAKRIFS